MSDRRREKRTSRLSVAISLVLHATIVGVLFFVAAREGMLGKELKKIAVTMVPREKLPEKPKEKPPEPEPAPEQPKTLAPTVAQALPERAAAAPPAPSANADVPVAAPPPASIPSFAFEGGKAVETTSDPNLLYKSFVEFTLRSRWNRPDGIDDGNYTAEVELEIDPQGRLLGTAWQKGSGDQAWDASVKSALAQTQTLGRRPPKGFPNRVVVRFDVQTAGEMTIE